MCGIAGIFRLDGLSGIDREAIIDMTDVIAYRGTDDKGVYISDSARPGVALGHRRLSIIDLSSAGHQPMTDPTGRYWIVFNGEIYNFQELRESLKLRGKTFRSTSDTEVLLYLYEEFGDSCLSMIEGMFAFAIWDDLDKTLFLARDRAGKKPLFYLYDGQKFLFASEIKSLLQHAEVIAEPNCKKFQDYLTLRYVPAPETLFKNIHKLPPASCATVSRKGLSIREFWDVAPPPPLESRLRVKDSCSEFIRIFKRAVEKRLIADVPVGVFLSGGIDSSAIVWAMHELLGKNIKTYSVGFASPWLSELKYAKKVAKFFDTDHHEILVTCDNFVENLPKLIWHRDLPVSEPADIPIHIMSRMASEKVKVVLSGEGSDELLGGYYKYNIEQWARLYRGLPNFLQNTTHRVANAMPFSIKKISHYLKAAGIKDDITRAFSWFGSMGDEQLLSKDLRHSFVNPEGLGNKLALHGMTGSAALAYIDLKYWLPDNLLERADRLTMASSIELRVPFLDQELIEFCNALHPSAKSTWLGTKNLLRETMRTRLPHEVLQRRKVGFTTPVSQWFREDLRDWSYDILHSDCFRNRGVFEQNEVNKLLDDHVSGKRDNFRKIWAVLNFELWFQIFFDKKGCV